MSEEILVRQGAPTLADIKTGSLFPCPCENREALLADIRQLNRRLSPKGPCLLPLHFLLGQALLLPIPPRRTAAEVFSHSQHRPMRANCQGRCLVFYEKSNFFL